MNWRVLLIDLDSQANASSSLGFVPAEGVSLYRALLGEVTLAEQVLPTRLDNLFLIPADLDLAGAEVEVARQDNHLVRLREIIQPLREDAPFDFVIMDCPPSLGILMTNSLAAADELLVPMQCEYLALEGLAKIVGVVEQIREVQANPGLAIGGIVMTMFEARKNLSQQVVNEVRTHFDLLTYQTAIPRTVRLAEAPSHGKTILEYESNGIGSKAYRLLAEEFIRRQRGEPPPSGEAGLVVAGEDPLQRAGPALSGRRGEAGRPFAGRAALAPQGVFAVECPSQSRRFLVPQPFSQPHRAPAAGGLSPRPLSHGAGRRGDRLVLTRSPGHPAAGAGTFPRSRTA